MRIDHHLQQSILQNLADSETALSYSDLKQPDIENSLFSYHLNKLIAQKLVQKEDDGYSLTIDGARWLNDNGLALKTREALRVSVGLVIQNTDGEYLIGQRAGQFKTQINDYLLPSLYYVNDLDMEDQINRVIQEYIPKEHLVKRLDFGFTQFKAKYDDKTMRLLISITYCQTKPFDPPKLQSRDYAWLSLDQIAKLDHPSATIIKQILAHLDEGDTHVTPLFVG